MKWQMQDSNLLLRLLLGGKDLTISEVKHFKPTNTFMWQRRTDVRTAWIYELKPEEYEFNNLEKDILGRIKNIYQK